MGGATPVVILADLADRHQRPQVLVGLVRVDVVEGTAVPGVTIGGCEVDGYLWGPRGWTSLCASHTPTHSGRAWDTQSQLDVKRLVSQLPQLYGSLTVHRNYSLYRRRWGAPQTLKTLSLTLGIPGCQ